MDRSDLQTQVKEARVKLCEAREAACSRVFALFPRIHVREIARNGHDRIYCTQRSTANVWRKKSCSMALANLVSYTRLRSVWLLALGKHACFGGIYMVLRMYTRENRRKTRVIPP